jgi:hypothetical protein
MGTIDFAPQCIDHANTGLRSDCQCECIMVSPNTVHPLWLSSFKSPDFTMAITGF